MRNVMIRQGFLFLKAHRIMKGQSLSDHHPVGLYACNDESGVH